MTLSNNSCTELCSSDLDNLPALCRHIKTKSQPCNISWLCLNFSRATLLILFLTTADFTCLRATASPNLAALLLSLWLACLGGW